MDRRAALTKMAGSAAVGAGAVLVRSSPAFADFGSVYCRPTDCTSAFGMNLQLLGPDVFNDYVQATMSSVAFGCAAGYSSSTVYKYRVFRVDGGGTAANAPQIKDCGSNVTLAPVGVWTPFLSGATICIKNGDDNQNLNNGTYRLEVIQRRICDNGTRRCWCCIGQTRQFVMVSHLPVSPSAGTFAVSNADCNS